MPVLDAVDELSDLVALLTTALAHLALCGFNHPVMDAISFGLQGCDTTPRYADKSRRPDSRPDRCRTLDGMTAKHDPLWTAQRLA